MSDAEAMKSITERGVDAQADLDANLTAALKAALVNAKVTEDGVAAGMVKSLEGKEMIWQAYVAALKIAESGLEAARLHKKQYAACVANDCDTGGLTSVVGVSLLAVAKPLDGGR